MRLDYVLEICEPIGNTIERAYVLWSLQMKRGSHFDLL